MEFQKQYENEVTIITDGLTHGTAKKVLEAKVKLGILNRATLTGYIDCCTGIYDKYWRYSTNSESEYLMGVQAAINNGACIEQYIEVSKSNLF